MGWNRLLVTAWLAGCGLLGDANRDPDQTSPVAGDELSEAEFEELEGRGDVFEVAPRTVEEERTAREARVSDAQDVIDDFLAEHPDLQGTLLQQNDPGAPSEGPNLVHTLADGTDVLLQGNDWDRLTVASAIERQQDAEHQADVLGGMLPLLPSHCRALAPPVESLDTLDAESLIEARLRVIRCWMDWSGVDPSPELPFLQPEGQGRDEWSEVSGSCDPTAPLTSGPGGGRDGYAEVLPSLPALQDWIHLDALPPVRNQARRGTCVAFASASAIEHTVRRRLGSIVDVSEQYLYSVGKYDFDGDDFDDGLDTVDFLEDLADERTKISIEDGWGYNPSRCRIENQGLERYRDSCVGYGGEACSNTAHQMLPVKFEGRDRLFRPASEATVQVTRARELTIYGLYAETVAHAELHLDAGYGVVASLRWPDNDWGIKDFGLRAGYATENPSGDEGGHAVHVIGWQRYDSVLDEPMVIIKNSWGSGWGDNGYAYLPLRYFGAALKSLVVVDVASERNTPPEVFIRENGQSYPQGTGFTLHADVSDAEDGENCCTFTWSQGGVPIGTGPTLSLNPTDLGRRRITVSARDRFGAMDQHTAEIQVYRNRSPTVRIDRPRVPLGQDWVVVPKGEWISFSGTVEDPDQGILCSDRLWTVEGSGSTADCTATRYILDEGTYTVTYEAEDDAGELASDAIRLVVRDWTEFDPPYIMFRTPTDGSVVRYDETVRVQYGSSPSLANGEVQVTFETALGTVATWTENRSFNFVPFEVVNVPNDRTPATLTVEWTVDGQTARDEITLQLQGPPN